MQKSHVDLPNYIKGLCEAHVVSKRGTTYVIPVIPEDLKPVLTS